MRNPLQRLTMAHPATERILTAQECAVMAMALGTYRHDAHRNMDAAKRLTHRGIREEAIKDWAIRAEIAQDLFDTLLPMDGSLTKVVVRW